MHRNKEHKIAFYCQHVLGIGHFHRSLEICRVLAATDKVTLITGGPPVPADFSGFEKLQLPGLQMDADFRELVPCSETELSVEDIKKLRQAQLYSFFEQEQPDIFITELYPFGRKAFRFELDPVLKAVKSGQLAPCFCCASVRDILVEKDTGRTKFEARVVATLNDYFDLVLVHADPHVIQLGATFEQIDAIKIPIHYTGFISKTSSRNKEIHASSEQIPAHKKLIVASIGGGNVGSSFLMKVVEGFKVLCEDRTDVFLQIFCGPYCPDEAFYALQEQIDAQIGVARFTSRFAHWLQAATLSVSMGGYNTCMDLLQAGVPALVYPFAQNREQKLRISLLEKKSEIALLSEEDLTPKRFCSLLQKGLQKSRKQTAININGAAETARQIRRATRGRDI